MAYLLTHFWPGGSEDSTGLRSPSSIHRTGCPPADLPCRRPTEDGFLIAAVWDSKESSDRFVRDTLLASMPVEGGFEGQPDERAAEISNLGTG